MRSTKAWASDQPTGFQETISGVKGLAHSRFGGPAERNPCSRELAVLRPRAFSLTPRQHCKSFAAKRKFFVEDQTQAALKDASRRFSGKKKESHEIRKYL
jgi:hypothetical protein